MWSPDGNRWRERTQALPYTVQFSRSYQNFLRIIFLKSIIPPLQNALLMGVRRVEIFVTRRRVILKESA